MAPGIPESFNMEKLLRTPTPSPSPSVAAPGAAREVRPEDEVAWGREVLRGGKHAGRTFSDMFATENSYIKFLYGKYKSRDLKDPSLIELCRYTELRLRSAPGQAMMATRAMEATYPEDSMVAVIDAGCNNTCHGAEWMKAYLKMTGVDIPLEPGEARFTMELEDEFVLSVFDESRLSSAWRTARKLREQSCPRSLRGAQRHCC